TAQSYNQIGVTYAVKLPFGKGRPTTRINDRSEEPSILPADSPGKEARTKGPKEAINKITTLSNYLEFYKDSAKERIKLRERIERLKGLFNKFNEQQHDLMMLSDEHENLELQREEITDHYDDVIASALELLERLSIAQNTIPTESSFSKPNSLPVNLPKINLPKFDGRIENWITFKDAFQIMIHAHEGLSNIQKLNYLKLSLSGRAETAIGAFTISDDNYAAAWEHLNEIYDNKRALVLRHAALLRDTPAMPNESSEAIRDLVNYMQLHIRSLQALGRSWEDIANDLLTSIVISRMGKDTRKTWERTLADTQMPKINDIFKFLHMSSHQCKDYESVSNTNPTQYSSPIKPQYNNRAKANNRWHNKRPSPPSSPMSNRRQVFVTEQRSPSCDICKTGNHAAFQCKTFLDGSVEKRIELARKAKLCLNCLKPGHSHDTCYGGRCKKCNEPHNTRLHREHGSTHFLMATAIVNAMDLDKNPVECRTLLDTCSNANFITESLVKKLRLPTREQSVTIEALNELNTVTNRLVKAKIVSRQNNFNRTLEFFVIPRIAGQLPDCQIDRTRVQIPHNIKLADPHFHKPAPVDMLIGTGPTLSCFSIGQINLSTRNDSDLVLQKSQFGWIIGGSAPTTSRKNSRTTLFNNAEFDLKKFWEVEEGPQHSHLTPEEEACESHFKRTVSRTATGRYVVALPFNEKKAILGETYTRALKRFHSLERRFVTNPELQAEYAKVLNEYLELGHLTQTESPANSEGFYLPHHAVIKPSSSTTKVRVVFDGSAKSSSGVSLNDALLTGPTIQDDIFGLLLRFRMHPFVLTGDIEKMYRQFLVREEDRPYQRILWRNAQNEISTFQLNTVTFGLSSAPYLATRCLQQLADDESQNYKAASEVIKRDIYVDDLLTGAATYRDVIKLRDQIISLLNKGELNIRQWVSNDPQLLSGLTDDQIHPKFFGDATVKTLGVAWDPRNDTIHYSVNINSPNSPTKRAILSTIAKIFDPLGLLGPVTVTAKIIMQRLWQLKIDWDESLPMNIQNEWQNYRNNLKLLEKVKFNRHITQRSVKSIELHGFCDASERAYGACIYIRTINQSGKIKTQLLCAKSRVAPLKTISLARLELCGANLLATLYCSVRESLTHTISKTTFWTDSTIVLHWLAKSPSTLKTFVANRVAEIQGKTRIKNWRHVRTSDNPADLLSRGITAKELIDNSFWVIAYCLRFTNRNRCIGPLSVEEIHLANERILTLIQQHSFSEEIHALKTGSELPSKSKLLCLSPFLDEKGILRVGGRLQNSKFSYQTKHPILLPKNNSVTNLIIHNAHIEHHHSGLTSTLYNVRQQYWPIDGKNTTRKILRNCVKCFRVNPPTTRYTMGNLPADRVTETRPFTNIGVDYCGPFFIKERKFRNRAKIKVYVAVFICFSTKAIHLEVVSDMTTEAFVAALKRFIARRGICKNIYSDNGTNFVGANNDLTELSRVLREKEHKRVRRFLEDKEMSWHFMPALSPHFGGLWEAAVKSFKHHLKRVVGDELFTYEQFATFVTEIEAILNSRPLTPLSSDPNDPQALTPGHFLIGSAMTSLPEVNFNETSSNRLSKWQHIQKVKHDFWIRWSKEYINHLNVRAKWTKGSHEMNKGTIVILKDDHLPPSHWSLGRIVEVHPGQDDIIRAVTVKTVNGLCKRNVKKLAPLPIET
ncbi:uncharacterized protein LOC143364282, partial [Halictus rubicundus]|uniref:uncharacterized protein LOC143364282 n=1 Tax=Halictus rubicundus TaxID=77578 RepID=UPI0040375E39